MRVLGVRRGRRTENAHDFSNKNKPMNYTLLLIALLFVFAVLAEVEVRVKKR